MNQDLIVAVEVEGLDAEEEEHLPGGVPLTVVEEHEAEAGTEVVVRQPTIHITNETHGCLPNKKRKRFHNMIFRRGVLLKLKKQNKKST